MRWNVVTSDKEHIIGNVEAEKKRHSYGSEIPKGILKCGIQKLEMSVAGNQLKLLIERIRMAHSRSGIKTDGNCHKL